MNGYRRLKTIGFVLCLPGCYTRYNMKVQGRLRYNPKGFAFCVTQSGQADVFVPPGGLGGAIDKDLVEVSVSRDKKGQKGRVLSILERGLIPVSGRYQRNKRQGIVIPFSPFPYTIIIPHGLEKTARNQDIVAVTIDLPASIKRTSVVTARVEYVMDIPDDAGADLASVVLNRGLAWSFSDKALAEASSAAVIDMSHELKRRKDIRDRILFTIDGADARDFDDAVGIEPSPDGGFVLSIAIADVAHVVKERSVLDQEAFARGFSVYFPGKCIPMLPEVLSNGILSLNPGQDRLAMVVEIHLGPRGRLIGYVCYEGIIRSSARLTYDQINTFFSQGSSEGIEPKITARLLALKQLTGYLHAKRIKKGALDLDMPERVFHLDSLGQVKDISWSTRGIAECIIEESMLMANHAVCLWLEKKEMPVFYRVHEAPDRQKLLDFADTLNIIGLDKGLVSRVETAAHCGHGIHTAFKAITDASADTPSGRLVSSLILRSLKQAVYSFEDQGHFGLACNRYLHFTSPIRRYPDLICHRLLKLSLKKNTPSKKGIKRFGRYLQYAGTALSERQRLVTDAMFDAIKLKTAAYMHGYIGKIFEGVITGITQTNAFVEIKAPPADGICILPDISGVRIVEGRYIRIRKKKITLGQAVRLRLVAVNRTKGLCDFALV